ncbi:Leucine-rich repeat neuronal protein 4 [Merluccius polli]|uniref:Leucine-rich repeat neuronal protein 4 n=1 Tax=Merluccius polli TaxID=89951 RepID=A0AA47M248_MERPO|nr:Leucine-rich repeat neuronal protein 4 [Merluccius polli]
MSGGQGVGLAKREGGWAWAVCMLCTAAAAAAADGRFVIPIPKIRMGTTDRPSSATTVPHSTANAIIGSRAPAYTTTESASLLAVAMSSTQGAHCTPCGGHAVGSTSGSVHLISHAVFTGGHNHEQSATSEPQSHSRQRGHYSTSLPTPSRHTTLSNTEQQQRQQQRRQQQQQHTQWSLQKKRTEANPRWSRTQEPKTAPAPLCDYDPCVHLQRPCPELKHLKGWNCRCSPAQSAGEPSATPGPVVALEVTRAWPTAASLRWCAPDSALSAFLVWVLRGDGSVVSNGSVSSWTRQADVYGLAAGGHVYSVCVSAQSAAGALSHRRCVAVTTANDAEAVAAYVLAGVCGVLLPAAVLLSLCLYRQCERRGQASHREPSAHLSPAVHSFRDPRLTCSMVSIANPAYTPADEQAASESAHCAHRAPAKKSTSVR